jgi:5-methyltetrahydropteroyltriglutamate--homocysteine methyltransferase
MKHSSERILTTHVGSLPRARALSDLLIAQEDHRPYDPAELDRLAREGVLHVVSRQIESGIDILNDGEQPRVGFQTYVGQRLEGFGGVSEREPFTDFAHFPDFRDIWLNRGMVMSKVFDAPAATTEVRYRDLGPAMRECDIFDEALAAHAGKATEAFMTAASPGIVCTTMRNGGAYDSHATYVHAMAGELRKEYELIHRRGYVLQLDCPDLAMERHGMFQHASLREFQAAVELHIAAINEACAHHQSGERGCAVYRICEPPPSARIRGTPQISVPERQNPDSGRHRLHRQLHRASAGHLQSSA